MVANAGLPIVCMGYMMVLRCGTREHVRENMCVFTNVKSLLALPSHQPHHKQRHHTSHADTGSSARWPFSFFAWAPFAILCSMFRA